MATDLAALVASVQDLLGRRNLSQQEFGDWLAGSAIGGPNANGTYPLTDSTGFVRMLPSPAKMQALSARDRGGVVYPDDFDALAGTGSGHDDAICIQAMFNAQYLTPYPRPTLRPRARYYIGSTITVDPSRNTLDGNSAQMGWDLKTFVDPLAQTNLVQDGEMDTGAPWVKSGNDNIQNVVYDGSLRFTQPESSTQYFERGQRLVGVKAGETMTITITIASITPKYAGVNTYHDVLFSLRRPASTPAASIGGGGNVGSSSFTVRDNSSSYAPNKTYTWTVYASVDDPYIRIQSNASAVIDSISARVIPNNKCLLVRVPASGAGGALRGHNQRAFRDFKISGRSGQGTFVEAVTFDTPKYGTGNIGQHSRCNWYNFDISDNIGVGLTFYNQTYLNNFYSCRIVSSQKQIYTIAGVDAGENICFYGGDLGGGKISVHNPAGYAFRFFGTSMDFVDQFLVGTNIVLTNCWLETNATKGEGALTGKMTTGTNYIVVSAADAFTEIGTIITGPGIQPDTAVTGYDSATKTLYLSKNTTATSDSTVGEGDDTPDTGTPLPPPTEPVPESGTWKYYLSDLDKPLIVCGGGKITLRDTLIQQDGTLATRLLYPFTVSNDGWLEIESNPPYNVVGRSGALCSGGGKFTFKVKGSGPIRNIEGINKRDDDHNILGSAGRFQGSIAVPAWLGPASGQQAVSRYEITQNNAGQFVGEVARGSTIAYGATPQPTASALGRVMRNKEFPDGTVIVDYQIAAASYTATTTVGSPTLTAVSPAPTASSTVNGKYPSGPGIPHGAKILNYNNANGTITLDRPCTSTNAGASVAVRNVLIFSAQWRGDIATGVALSYFDVTGDSAIMRTTDLFTPYEGTRCLEIFKNLPSSEPLQAYLACPLEPNRSFGSELRWAVPADPTATSGTGAVFFQPYLARILDLDTAPRIVQRLQITDTPKTGIPYTTGTEGWTDSKAPNDDKTMWRRVATSLNSPGLGLHVGYSPDWATHLVWTISMQSMRRGSRLLLGGFIGNNQ